jgi:methionine salvage enolase-phosphatase E1
MFQNTEIIFVSASPQLLEAAKSEGFHTLDPAKENSAKEFAPSPAQ